MSPVAAQTESFQFSRFIEAQAPTYDSALAKIRRGLKRSHWMWFIFPQIAGLSKSPTAQFYAIKSLDEACAYLTHPLLGARLRECVEALQDLPPICADEVFGVIDAMKLRSSLTLFVLAGGGPLFEAAHLRWGGSKDPATLTLLGMSS